MEIELCLMKMGVTQNDFQASGGASQIAQFRSSAEFSHPICPFSSDFATSPIGKNNNNIANFFSVHFSEVKLFCCLSLLRLWPMLAMVARPSSNYVLFSSKEKVFEKL